MKKHFINSAIVYTIIALVGGVFYREFTKFNSFTDQTTLSIIHTHYLVLGTFFFLIMLCIEKSFKIDNLIKKKNLAVYHIGLNLTSIMFLVRGISQVLNIQLTNALNASISGIAGVGHILLGVSLIIVLINIKKQID